MLSPCVRAKSGWKPLAFTPRSTIDPHEARSNTDLCRKYTILGWRSIRPPEYVNYIIDLLSELLAGKISDTRNDVGGAVSSTVHKYEYADLIVRSLMDGLMEMKVGGGSSVERLGGKV